MNRADHEIPEQIESYVACDLCARVVNALGIHPREFMRLAVGFTPDGGLQIVCTRHGVSVLYLTAEDLQGGATVQIATALSEEGDCGHEECRAARAAMRAPHKGHVH